MLKKATGLARDSRRCFTSRPWGFFSSIWLVGSHRQLSCCMRCCWLFKHLEAPWSGWMRIFTDSHSAIFVFPFPTVQHCLSYREQSWWKWLSTTAFASLPLLSVDSSVSSECRIYFTGLKDDSAHYPSNTFWTGRSQTCRNAMSSAATCPLWRLIYTSSLNLHSRVYTITYASGLLWAFILLSWGVCLNPQLHHLCVYVSLKQWPLKVSGSLWSLR